MICRERLARAPSVIAVALIACRPGPVLAGPPLMTDDPQPVDYQHYELRSPQVFVS